MGYHVNSSVLSSADYGAAKENDCLLSAKNKIGKFEFPETIFDEENYITCGCYR